TDEKIDLENEQADRKIINFTRKECWQYPNRYKEDLRKEVKPGEKGDRFRKVIVFKGDRGSRHTEILGEEFDNEIAGEQLAQIQQDMRYWKDMHRLVRLRDKPYTSTVLAEEKVEGKPAVEFRIKRECNSLNIF